jgi:transposase
MSGAVPYANSRPELAGISLGEKVRLVMSTTGWSEVMHPLLTALEELRPRKGPAPAYSSEELESCLLYQRLAGASTYGEARARLAGDRAEADRIALGFNGPRKRVGTGLRLVKSLDGVPSEATVWRHKARFGLDEHVAAYRTLFERLVRDHFEEFPELAQEATLVHWDGSVLLSHYTSFERLSKKTGEIKPPTLDGGGYRPRTKDNAGKDGHGFNLVAAVTQTGLPLGARLTPINEPEGKTARAILEGEWRRTVAPYLQDDLVRVMACDAAYSGAHFRQAIHRAGFLPNCHPVSHSTRERSLVNASRKDKAKLKIQYHEKWHLNGHHELACACGEGQTIRRASKNADGEAVSRLEGTCPNCKSVSLTVGRWRLAGNSKAGNSIAKATHRETDKIDWRIGNPLTFNDPLSKAYGSARFGHNEGWHGALVTRFGLLKEKAWYRSGQAAERDLLQVFVTMHALAMEQRRRAARGKDQPSAPLVGMCRAKAPPLARAA